VTDAVAAQLLDALSARLEQPDLEYVEPLERLTGGYYTDNRSFRVNARDPNWSARLVLRLFPREGPPEQVRREFLVQSALTAQGFPVPNVLWCEEQVDVVGRRFLVMEFLDGRSPMGGAEFSAVLRAFPWLVVRMPTALARTQAALHELSVGELTDAPDGLSFGVDRWLDVLDDAAASGAPELEEAARWLRANRPTERRLAICHGDLWPGNLLVERGRVTSVLDWSVATVAEPALDVGFTAMGLTIAPIEAGPRVEAVILRQSRWMCRRYVKAYRSLTGADLAAQPYYEALRCALELIHVVEHRRALTNGVERDAPTPTWDVASDRMIEYFESRTGVRLQLPKRIVR
jgi:aminoglycoside phosphotransferase (APT) family kinase protein